MSAPTESSSGNIQSSLKKYLRQDALAPSVDEALVAFLGTYSQDADREAFVEYVESEYLASGKHKLSRDECVVIGVHTLLDGMQPKDNGRTPTLNQLLTPEAFKGGNTATYDKYLGELHTRNEERDFRLRLTYLKALFGVPLDEPRAMAVAEYMLGAMQHEAEADSEEEDESAEEEESSEEEQESSEEEEESEESEEEEESEPEPEPEPVKKKSKNTKSKPTAEKPKDVKVVKQSKEKTNESSSSASKKHPSLQKK